MIDESRDRKPDEENEAKRQGGVEDGLRWTLRRNRAARR
jgi:hypothetical protein